MSAHERYFELGGAVEIGNISPQSTAETLETMADELYREGNKPGGGRSELFRAGNLWDGGGF